MPYPGSGEPSSSGADSAWSASTPPRRRAVGRLPASAPAHSAASLAAAVHQLLGAITGKRVPRIETLRLRLQQAETSWRLNELDQALHQLQHATDAIDFLAGRGKAAHIEQFRAQGAALGAAARRLASISMNCVGRHAAEAALARLVWIELQLEARAIDKRVRQALPWLAGLDRQLAARRAATTAEVSQRALQELVRRSQVLENRLHQVQGLCGATRAAGTLGDQVWAQRGVLCRVLQDRVRGASLQLQEQLQPLLEAAGQRPLQPAELIAAIDVRHALQVALTQASAELMQLQSLQQELGSQLAWMERKAAAIDK